MTRTNDRVLISAVVALLDGAGIKSMVFDQNMSVLEGSLGMLQARVLVADGFELRARQVLQDAGLGHELAPRCALKRAALETSDDAVLGGRLLLRQPLRGHRVGHDAMLLAAATGGRAGEHAVDLGSGVGAAGLALADRVKGLRVTLVDIDAALCDLATGNAERNGLAWPGARRHDSMWPTCAAFAASGLRRRKRRPRADEPAVQR